MKKKLKKAGLYNPYLDVLGGGEKHVLSFLKVLEEEGFEINIFWDEDLSFQIEEKLFLKFKKINWLPNIFKKRGNWWKKINFLKEIEIFFYVPDGSYFFSLAKKNFVFCMVPKRSLYPKSFFDRIKTFNFQFLANSCFTASWLKKWGLRSQVIYPYIDDKFLNVDINRIKKEKIILSVGRFFSHLHSKNHEIIIKTFQKLKNFNRYFKDFKLIIVGGLKKEDSWYFEKIKNLAFNDKKIILLPNLSFDELFRLYQKSSYYWHFTGFGIDEKKLPEQVEHLGIAPLEAMAAGNIVFCYKAGGSKEIVSHGINGFLFKRIEEIFIKMVELEKDSQLKLSLQKKALDYVSKNFSYKIFKEKVKKIIL